MLMQSGRFSACSTVKSAAEKLAEFKKGNKRDAALYPILKDHRFWNNWNRSVLAQVRAHDLKEVFDLENEPKEGDKELFEESRTSPTQSLTELCRRMKENRSFGSTRSITTHEMCTENYWTSRPNLRLLN